MPSAPAHWNRSGRVLLWLALSALACASGHAADPQPLPWNNLRIGGELATRIQRNFDRLESEIYRPDHLFTSSPNSADWPGDYEGRALLGLTLDAQTSHRAPQYLDELWRRFPAHLNAAGYFGLAMPPGSASEQQLASHGWVLRALCEDYRWRQRPETLAWINQILDHLALPSRGLHRSYPIEPGTRQSGGGGAAGSISHSIGAWTLSTDTGCDFIFLDGVVQALGLTGRDELRPLIDEMIARFCAMDLLALRAQTHASLTALRGLLRYYELTRDSALLAAAQSRFDLYCREALTGNFENDNWFGRPEWTEPCAVVDSHQIAIALWRFTGQPAYLELAEHIYYNGLAFAQRANGGFGLQKCSAPARPFLQVAEAEAYWCCTMRGAEGLASVAQSAFFTDAAGIYLIHFTPAEATLALGDRGTVTLREETSYPFGDEVRLHVVTASPGLESDFRLAAPSWLSAPSVQLNGRRIEAGLRGGFLRFHTAVRPGDVITYRFQPQSGWFPPDAAATLRRIYFGPLLLTADPTAAPDLPNPLTLTLRPGHRFAVHGTTQELGTAYHLLDPIVTAQRDYRRRIYFQPAAQAQSPNR